MKSPANSFFHSVFAAFLKDLLAQEIPTSSDNFKKSIALLVTCSEVRITLEESSHWASLMARGLSLGPSNAPCLVETSTAHGEQFFWDPISHTGKNMNLWISASDSGLVHCLFQPLLHSPEMIPALQISSPFSDSRRSCATPWQPVEKLRFSPVDLVLNIGPTTPRRPKPINSYKNYKTIKPRSVFSLPMSNLRKALCRFLLLCGGRLHVREVTLLLTCLFIYYMQILVLVAFSGLRYDYQSLKIYGLNILNRSCWSINCGLGLNMCNERYLSNCSSDDLKLRPFTTIPII